MLAGNVYANSGNSVVNLRELTGETGPMHALVSVRSVTALLIVEPMAEGDGQSRRSPSATGQVQF